MGKWKVALNLLDTLRRTLRWRTDVQKAAGDFQGVPVADFENTRPNFSLAGNRRFDWKSWI
jgi:hypothetical protein